MTKTNNNQRYARSMELLQLAEMLIPTGTQTFSKSSLQFPIGKSPHFLHRGQGGRVWDIDGNEYVDIVAGLLSVMLGYRDPDVDAAIMAQLERGITFSLATELEYELATRLTAMIPCAEMVRFAKNGTDATSAAIRIARAVTGRDHIITCGYHGWQDWYIGSTVRHKGVPDAVRSLTHVIPYNDINALESAFASYPDNVAAVILEPASIQAPGPDYLEEVKSCAQQHGAILIFDEIITGFRFAAGGAQELFDVTPDLACFGKALGNGMPISVVAGKAELMRQYEDTFISGTFGGEALSLAAAIAVVDKIQREPVIDKLWQTGDQLGTAIKQAISNHGLENVLGLSGYPPWQILTFKDHENASQHEIKTLYMVSMLEQGVLTIGSHNIIYAHSDEDVTHVIRAYDKTLETIATELRQPGLAERLGCDLVQPVFAVRGP